MNDTVEDNDQDFEKFTNWIKTIAIYLGQFSGSNKRYDIAPAEYEKIDSIGKYDGYILKKYLRNHVIPYYRMTPNYVENICILNSNYNVNTYTRFLIDNIFPIFYTSGTHRLDDEYYLYWYDIIPYQSLETAYNLTYRYHIYGPEYSNEQRIGYLLDDMIKEKKFISWRSDINIPCNHKGKIFSYTINKLKNSCPRVKGYTIFWNLFLLAIDDEAYNEQTADVMSLAQKFGFDEAMMRDWCNAVKYVLDGNMFSEDCDLVCETEEARRFFLHKE